MKTPLKFPGIQVQREQTVEACRRQEHMSILATYLMTVFKIAVLVGADDTQVAVVAEQFVARGNINVVSVKGDTTQTPVSAPALEVDIASIPVDVLLALLIFEVDREHATVTFALLAASDD